MTWIIALFFSCCEIKIFFSRQHPTAETSAILFATEVLIPYIFDHYRLEDSRTLQDLSYISMASKNDFCPLKWIVSRSWWKNKCGEENWMHDSDVLFKNIISTLRYCVLFFSGESLVVIFSKRVRSACNGPITSRLLVTSWLSHQIESAFSNSGSLLYLLCRDDI